MSFLTEPKINDTGQIIGSDGLLGQGLLFCSASVARAHQPGLAIGLNRRLKISKRITYRMDGSALQIKALERIQKQSGFRFAAMAAIIRPMRADEDGINMAPQLPQGPVKLLVDGIQGIHVI